MPATLARQRPAQAHSVAALREVVASDPNHMSAHGYLADALLAQGDSEGFLREGQRAAELRGDTVVQQLFADAANDYSKAGRDAMLDGLSAAARGKGGQWPILAVCGGQAAGHGRPLGARPFPVGRGAVTA